MQFSLSSKFSSIAAIIIPIGMAVVLLFFPSEKLLKLEKDVYVAPPEVIQHFTFGYSETMADVFWIRVLQDLDFCDSERAVTVNKGVGLDSILSPVELKSRCDRGWVFRMLDAVTELAPRFRLAHYLGATLLSVLNDDREGARIIFDKGVERFPTDWQLSYRAAYHYLFEIREPAKAAGLLILAHKNGGPEWLPILAARLYSKAGQAELGRSVLLNLIEQQPEGPIADRARKRLSEIEAETSR